MKLKIYMKVWNGKIEYLCLRENKGCSYPCTKETVDYDQYKGVKDCFRQDKYGK